MAAVITLEKLTKSYGSSRGIIDIDMREADRKFMVTTNRPNFLKISHKVS